MVSQRIVAHEFGPPLEVLRLQNIPTPEVGAGGVRGDGMDGAGGDGTGSAGGEGTDGTDVATAVVRMVATPINPSDLIPVTGAYRTRTDLPFVPGFEGVGVVESVFSHGASSGGGEASGATAGGHQSTDHPLVGKRVIPIGSAGGWQTYKTCDTSWCFQVPDDISNADAAMAYVNPITAIRMVEAHVGPTNENSRNGDPSHDSPGNGGTAAEKIQVAVVSAAGSAIAQILRYLLAQRGVRTIGLQRAERPNRKHDMSQWDAMITTSEPNWQYQLRETVRTLRNKDSKNGNAHNNKTNGDTDRAGGGVHNRGNPDIVFDSVGGETGTWLAKQLRHGGTLVHYGLLSGQPLSPTLWDARPDLTVDLFHLRNWVHHTARANITAAFDTAFQLIRESVIRTPVQAELGLADFAEAIRLATDNAAAGKVLLRP